MVTSVHLISETNDNVALEVEQIDFKNRIVFNNLNLDNLSRFDLEITFQEPIELFRNHDYSWVPINKNRIANWYAPKILKLKNGSVVQANRSIGIWEIDKKRPTTLLWRFNPENAHPIAQYTGVNHQKEISQACTIYDFSIPLALLFPKENGLEVSRSLIPFSAIVCFTDHCDFDTLDNLKKQRGFFKEKGVKITKGFFLNQFSKRADNASFETDSDELVAWKDDGHELAYHSLSQSVKSKEESFTDFKNFKPPLNNLVTWIDHGYQPYNVSLNKASELSKEEYEQVLVAKNIHILWNYIDSGSSVQGVINQINPEHFTLHAYVKGLKGLGFFKSFSLLTKNILFYFVNNPKHSELYKVMASNFRKKRFLKLVGNLLDFLKIFIPILIFYKTKKHTVYPLAQYTPLFFRHRIEKSEFIIFQTLEMVDFKKGLSKSNVDILMKEKGICIAHTYFSVPLDYHEGKLFSQGNIEALVGANFSYLAGKITQEAIWNPTLKELVNYLCQMEDLEFDMNLEGAIYLKSKKNLITRVVTI
nr:hypothetical protein [uncultured Psychroserpens sp.]